MAQVTSYLVQEAMVSMMMVLMVIVGMVIAVIEKAAAGQKAEMATEAYVAKTHRKEGRGGVPSSSSPPAGVRPRITAWPPF
jgi:hypothetical protein